MKDFEKLQADVKEMQKELRELKQMKTRQFQDAEVVVKRNQVVEGNIYATKVFRKNAGAWQEVTT